MLQLSKVKHYINSKKNQTRIR